MNELEYALQRRRKHRRLTQNQLAELIIVGAWIKTERVQAEWRRFLNGNLPPISQAIYKLEDSWWNQAIRRFRPIKIDLAPWMVGKSVGEFTSDNTVAGTNLNVEHLRYIRIQTNAVRYTLHRVENQLLIKTAVRLDPKAALQPR